MRKVLFIIVAIAGLVTFGVRATLGNPNGLSSPVIVAKGNFLNQNAPIEPTTIFTPTVTGLYRVSAYAVVSKKDPAGSSVWTYGLSWTDSGGPEAAYPGQYQYGKNHGQFLNEISMPGGGPSTVIEAAAGKPIMVSMSQGGNPDNAEYSLFYAVEQLQ